jgi:hypothetical protein
MHRSWNLYWQVVRAITSFFPHKYHPLRTPGYRNATAEIKHLTVCTITYSAYWKLIPDFPAIKHCNLGLKDAVPQHHGHYKRPHKLPPWRLERRHHCKCWQMLACVSFHTESVIHNVFQTIEPAIFEVHMLLVINNKMNAQQRKRDLNKALMLCYHWF